MDEKRQDGLSHFRAVRDGLCPPQFQQARALRVKSSEGGWSAHAQAIAEMRQNKPAFGMQAAASSLLDLKIALADRMLDSCDLCPHHCCVNRNAGKIGFCGVADKTAVHWEGILQGEEIELLASHEVFLSGCTMRCAFCYSHDHITRPMSGLPMAPTELAGCISQRHQQGAANLNLVGGEPTVHIPNILRTLRHLDAPLPVVWNSNMYATPEAMTLLDGVVDLFLGDIHFGNEHCARRLGQIPDYLPSVQAALVVAVSSGASVIIRHLVMPGHLECCARPAMEWAARALPHTPFHLMFQYVPDFRAVGDPILGRFLSPEEIMRAKAMAEEIGVLLYEEGGFPQECPLLDSAGNDQGQSVDILIQGDGRVSFTRLLPDLVPVAAALIRHDPRVLARTNVMERGE